MSKISTKKVIKDPEYFLSHLDGTNPEIEGKRFLDVVVDAQLDKSTEDWKARGGANKIRSSTLGKCERQSYYSYYIDTPDQDGFDRPTKKRLFNGQILEDYTKQYMDIKVDCTCHIDQVTFPVHIKNSRNPKDQEYVATTDFVLEFEESGEKYFIPIELKSTTMRGWCNKDTKEETFFGHQWHKEQLMLWCYYAKRQNLNVPYGILLYVHGFFNQETWANVHKKDYEIKPIIIPIDQPFKKMGRHIIDWNVHYPYLDAKVKRVQKHIKDKTLPVANDALPNYMCDGCAFKQSCRKNINLPLVKERK